MTYRRVPLCRSAPIIPPQPPELELIDFRKVAKQQQQAWNTHKVYKKGMDDYKVLAEELKTTFGKSPESRVQKMPKLQIHPDMTIREAMRAIENYKNRGKKQVEELARKTVKLDAQIEEETKVRALTDKLWKAAEPEAGSPFSRIFYFRKQTRVVAVPRPIELHINPLHGIILGYCFNGLCGSVLGGLSCHLFNQLRLTIRREWTFDSECHSL